MMYHATILNRIFNEVVLAEKCRKDLSRALLVEKDKKGQIILIYSFLCYELDKHEMFHEAALLAQDCAEQKVIDQLMCYYRYSPGNDLLERIKAEINSSAFLVHLVKKKIAEPDVLSFMERRYIQEIGKYVMSQARLYAKQT
jgi:hypothetical protein